jgi:hypothetical protein
LKRSAHQGGGIEEGRLAETDYGLSAVFNKKEEGRNHTPEGGHMAIHEFKLRQ